ncbi:MAG TPA: bifunctional phosphoribosylaminoimidazolecarboxamide formyltransferase/IMP cyclohydrolase, partial [Candidatus Kapabacteria bacterium]|nr:bifunctional phosphoribosylaminoimidazolecarboxamide formyltransferase/IMP cyclohydrolase [Candidatus Kapabacteria bacterium]
VVVNPDRYSEIIAYLKAGQSIPEDYRLKLAGEVFSHTAYYDSLIAKYFNQYNQIEIPEKINLSFNLSQTLRYGENPHQKAALYGYFNCIFEKLHGKELSFNNIIDISAATELISEFDELALAIIKHTNPCGVALGNTIAEAFEKALTTDNVSPFGGIIAVNRKIDSDAANAIHSMFTEVIIAPDFTDDALELLMKKKDRRLIKVNFELLEKHFDKNIRSVPGGLLVQDSDNLLLDESNLQVVTKRKPTDDELQSMKFAWKVCKHVKSNAIVYAKSDRTLAIGAGQMSRVDSSRIAVEKAKLQGIDLTGSAIASDAFFPFDDGVRYAATAGATAVIQPGGSVRDEEVIKSADELNLTMIFTGIRHFRH